MKFFVTCNIRNEIIKIFHGCTFTPYNELVHPTRKTSAFSSSNEPQAGKCSFCLFLSVIVHEIFVSQNYQTKWLEYFMKVHKDLINRPSSSRMENKHIFKFKRSQSK